jgi:predicted type IV restriction endonuclease
MPTQFQEKTVEKALRDYRKRYLTKSNMDADEATARIMINNFLSSVLGYQETIDIRTEYAIKGTYADYVIQLNKKIQFVVEAKAVSIDLNDKHLKQAIDYAANEGIDWVLLSNGRQIQLHRVLFEKPIRSQMIFSFDLTDLPALRSAARQISYLTKKSVLKNELESYWKKFDALTNQNIIKHLHSEDVVGVLRRRIKRLSGISFDDKEITRAIDSSLRGGR